jgi:parvulin-like peptidyl-prolyl isomerase
LLAYDVTNITLNDIITQWINEELLYQAAISSDLGRDETLQKMITNYKRKLLGNTFLESRSNHFPPVTSEDVSDYYQENKSMFIRNTDEARIYHFVLPSLKEARSVFRILSTRKSGTQRRELFTTYRVDAITVKKGYLVPEIDDALFHTRSKAQILGPIQTSSGYHIIEVLERHSKGSRKSLNEVYDEIYQRLVSERRALANLRVVDSLRLNSHIEVLTENINGK